MTDAITRRLRFWLGCMTVCERWSRHGTGLYFWLVRRAASCNRWRKQ